MTMIDWRMAVDALTVSIAAMNVAISFSVLRRQVKTAAKLGIEKLVERVDGVEKKIIAMPNHADLSLLSSRVALLETGVAVAVQKIQGVCDIVSRVEHGLGLVHAHLLNADK